jgi:peroxiredoxin Q/BCP
MAKTTKKTIKKMIKKPTKKPSLKTTKKSIKKTAVKKAAPKLKSKAKLAVSGAKILKATRKAPPKATTKVGGASKSNQTTFYQLKVGDRLPAFSGELTSGKVISQNLQDAHKALVLYFYPKDNTPGCTLEGQDFRRLYKQFRAAGVEIVGVSQDSVSSHEKFKSKCDFPFDLLSDSGGTVCKAFDVIQMKSMYGRDFEGIERSTFLIQNGVIKKEWRKVRVDGHAQEVLDSVKSL